MSKEAELKGLQDELDNNIGTKAEEVARKQRVDNLEQEIVEDVESDLDDVPEKYRNKSLQDVIHMHQEAEREKSRLGNELGSLRELSDRLIGLQRADNSKGKRTERKPVTPEEILSDPEKAIRGAVEEDLESIREENRTLARQLQREQFFKNHPNAQKDMTDSKFAEWVQASSYRLDLLRRADAWDLNAAEELFFLWEERQQMLAEAQTQKDATKEARRKDDLRAASLESPVGASVTDVVYDRKKLLDLKIRAKQGDRRAADMLAANEERLMKAYQDKRVR